MSPADSPERIQKLLALVGIGSRREIEKWIAAGKISVNGKIANLGERISKNDKIIIDGQRVRLDRNINTKQRILAYHKLAGEVSTRKDERNRNTVFDHLPRIINGRWISVGRLDISTFGLLLFTNDGEIANQLMHPSSGIEREYAVRVLGNVDDDIINKLNTGVDLEDGLARFVSIKDAGGEGANHWYHVILKEGRHREVRRLWESQGVAVSRLIRIRFGSFKLPRNLRPGKYRELSTTEIKNLLSSCKKR